MDIEAHWITLNSIILGLGLTEMFGNLHRLMRNKIEVHWDPLPLAWMATVFMSVLNYWWALYLRLEGSQQARTAAEFGLILAPALLLFLAMASVLPSFGDQDDWDMRRHYATQSRTFVITFAAYELSTLASSLVIGKLGPNYPTLARLIIVGALVPTSLTNARRWHWAAVLTIMLLTFLRLTSEVVQ